MDQAESSAASSKPEAAPHTDGPSPDHAQHARMLEEANQVLEAIGGTDTLNGFNLLGVTANPTGLPLTQSSFHGRYSHTSAPSHARTESGDYFADTYSQIEMTLSQVTEQVDFLNQVLEDWSHQILDEDLDDEAHIPESQLTEAPEMLRNLDTSPLQHYLEESGMLAHALTQRWTSEDVARNTTASERTTSATTTTRARRPEAIPEEPQEDEIPDIFFQSDFDLTDPSTFSKLLLVSDEEAEQVNGTASIQGWFPLPPPETFGGYLDKVELSLLSQVRNKSGAFFEESLRFAQLQEWIQSLLVQVVQLQETCRHLQQDLVEPQETVPIADDQRADLIRLLTVMDQANELVRCKSSIGGLLSAQDDLGAIEQIQYGRRLLAGRTKDNENDEAMELGRLQSLHTVTEQLNQYEQLVVTNLREELVEIFLGWNTSAVSSIYAVVSINGTGGKSAQVKQRVREIVDALQKCHGLERTRQAYSNRLQDVIRMTVRTTVGEFASDASSDSQQGAAQPSISAGVMGMSLERFLDCLDMLFEQLLALLTSSSGVDEFCVQEEFLFEDEKHDKDQVMEIRRAASTDSSSTAGQAASVGSTTPATPMAAVVAAAAELSSKSISELLRLRKDAHSLVSLEEMKRIWDTCVSFTQQIENLSGHKAVALRSTLLAQAKAFVERKHESNMSALVAALDSERWTQCEVSIERQNALTRLCTGRSVLSSPAKRSSVVDSTTGEVEKQPDANVEGTRYKTVWSCLLLIEMVMNNIATAAHFQSLASNVVNKICELLRLFNSRTTQLVLGAGAIHSAAKLKSINAKHLSLVTQCLGMVIAILPHVRAALMAQMPPKQHTLLSSIDQIKKDYAEHNEKVLNKFVTIIGGIVEHGLAPKIAGTNFDARAKVAPSADGSVACCIFLEGVSTNTRKMHQVLKSLLPPDHLQDVFSRIFAFVDNKVPALLIAATEAPATSPKKAANGPNAAGAKPLPPAFAFPTTEAGKKHLLLEVGVMTRSLNGLEGVNPWDFTAVDVLERKLDYRLEMPASPSEKKGNQEEAKIQKDDETSDAGTELSTETGVTTDPGETDENASKDSPQKQKPSVEPNGDLVHKEAAQSPSKEQSTSTEALPPSESVKNGASATADAAPPLEATPEPGCEGVTSETVVSGGNGAMGSDEKGSSEEDPSKEYPSEVTAL